MTQAAEAPLLDDGADQGSPSRRPLVPSDPWQADWTRPAEADVAQRHKEARLHQRSDSTRPRDSGATRAPVAGPLTEDHPDVVWSEPAEDTAIEHKDAASFINVRSTAPETTSSRPSVPDVYQALIPVEEPEPSPPVETHPDPLIGQSEHFDDEQPEDPPEQPSDHRFGAFLSAVLITATAYWYYVLATLVIAVAVPIAAGWESTTVISGSMEPQISAGDVVAFSDYDDEPLGINTIILFEDPARPGATVTHRIVDVNQDGTYRTKGDANATADSTPVPPEAILGVATLLSPKAGLPQLWFATSQYPWLAAWIVITAGALTIITLSGQRESRAQGPRSWLRPVVAIGLVAALAGVGSAARSSAAYATNTTNQDNQLTAAATFTSFNHLRSLGVATCSDTSDTTLSIGATVPVGSTIIIRYAMRNRRQNATLGASDTQGNSYSVDANAVNRSRTQTAVLSGHVTTALSSGDQITVTHPRGRAVVVSFDEYSGVAATSRVSASSTSIGNSRLPSVTVQAPNNDTLVIGSVSTNRANATYTQPSGWSPLDFGQVRCNRRMTYGGAWSEYGSSANVTYNPVLNRSSRWAAAAVAYNSG